MIKDNRVAVFQETASFTSDSTKMEYTYIPLLLMLNTTKNPGQYI
jgi:hypothetical protein